MSCLFIVCMKSGVWEINEFPVFVFEDSNLNTVIGKGRVHLPEKLSALHELCLS